MLSSEKFRTLTQKIAEYLHYDWQMDSDDEIRNTNRVKFTKHEQEITLTNGGWQNENRIRISGHFPHPVDGRWWHGINSPSITVTEKKDALTIVKDMQRRLIPEYIESLKKVITSNNERNKAIAMGEASLAAVAEALGTTPIQFSGTKSGEGAVHQYDLHRFKANYRYQGEFEVSLDLPLEKVLDLINFLNNTNLTTIRVSEEDLVEYARENDLNETEEDHLITNMEAITDQLVAFIQDTGWRHYFNEACGAYITGLRLEA